MRFFCNSVFPIDLDSSVSLIDTLLIITNCCMVFRIQRLFSLYFFNYLPLRILFKRLDALNLFLIF